MKKKLGAKPKKQESVFGIAITPKNMWKDNDKLPCCIAELSDFRIFVIRRDDDKTHTEFMNTGKVVGEITLDDGTSSIERDRVVIVLRK